MANITAALIQELREKTSAGMMDCKAALTENNGDIQAASDWLRQKGIVKAAKKADRVAAAGLVAAAKSKDGTFGVIAEVNAETDFVAKNEKFQKLVADVVQKSLEVYGDCGCKCDGPCDCDQKCFARVVDAMSDEVGNLIATIGENMQIRRIAAVGGDSVFKYVHNCLCTDMGQIAVIVALNGDTAGAAEIGPKIAMHIAANKPEFATVDQVDPAAVEREKKIFTESGATAGKPDAVVEKMVAGRIQKYYGESVLTEQPFVMDPNKTVKAVLAEANTTLAGFAYFLLGEGIQKREDNLADEVNKMLGN
ncbi:MAG: translation elongation factor Ts [Proteobacteria bacterium]|nr:translation elongation factor Ts [Pseudomonadota bacterium]